MFLLYQVLLIIMLSLLATSDLSNSFATFNDFNVLLAGGVSEKCIFDIKLFIHGLFEYLSTLKLCAMNRGCDSRQKDILKKNMFAVKQIDSFGKIPPGIMELVVVNYGSFIECSELLAPYPTHYCYAGIQTKNVTMQNPLLENSIVKLAVCMPRSCNEHDIPMIMSSVVNQDLLHLHFPSAVCVPTNVHTSLSSWIFMAFVSFLVTLIVFATITDYCLGDGYNRNQANITMRVFLALSFYTNSATILDVRRPGDGTLKSLASIRFISMTWVAAGHVIGEGIMGGSLKLALSAMKPLLSTTFTNAFFSVDTFFLLSGILVAYLFFKSRPSTEQIRNPMTWVLFYVHRYLRLTPPIMIFIWFYTIILPFDDGPWNAALSNGNTSNIKQSVERCEHYWWRNALYINNFFDRDEDCYGITWYLAVDTQLYIVAPIFLIALYISPIIGFIMLLLSCVASIVYTYVITYRDDLPATLIGVFALRKTSIFFSEYYKKPWTRCTPYLIGLGVGYFLAQCKEKKLKLSKISVVLGWILATSVALCCLYGVHGYQKGDDNWSKFLRATYNNLSRIGWALSVSWVIVANHLGCGGLIAAFMDHPLWQPLGRLSYCGYIVHFFIIHYVFNLDDRPYNYVSIWQTYVYRAIPVVVLSYILAFIWSCIFEIPTINLEKILVAAVFPKKKSLSCEIKEPVPSWKDQKMIENSDEPVPQPES